MISRSYQSADYVSRWYEQMHNISVPVIWLELFFASLQVKADDRADVFTLST